MGPAVCRRGKAAFGCRDNLSHILDTFSLYKFLKISLWDKDVNIRKIGYNM